MTDQQINQRIAEVCEWKPKRQTKLTRTGHFKVSYENPPDYCTDLNAMHEAEKVLTDNQFMRYSRWIENFMQSPHYRSYLSASARQRAEAFLRTLGKWEEVQA